jgi:hypothetical protein
MLDQSFLWRVFCRGYRDESLDPMILIEGGGIDREVVGGSFEVKLQTQPGRKRYGSHQAEISQ